jgi:hypothetical protein
VEIAKEIPKLPVEITKEIPKLPVEITKEIQKLPVEITKEIPKLPVEITKEIPKLPVEITKEIPKLPIKGGHMINLSSSSSINSIDFETISKMELSSASSVYSGIMRPKDMIPLNNQITNSAPKAMLKSFSEKLSSASDNQPTKHIMDNIITSQASF